MSNIPNMYFHSIAWKKNPLWNRSYLTLKLRFFEDLVRHLARHGFQFISLDEYIEFQKNGSGANNKLVCLTFDDGFLDNYVFAYPVLKKYRAKGTIFVNPDYVQENEAARPTLEDVCEGRLTLDELPCLGFASWKELQIMQDSGVMDIQSHTMTHAKFYVSDRIRDFHHPGSDHLHPIANLYPRKKPYHITDPEFATLLPWGTPFFEERSAVIAHRVTINDDFQKECIGTLTGSDWHDYSFARSLNRIEGLYRCYRTAHKLILNVETTGEYEARVRKELADSKAVLEKQLGKPVGHCCWPCGDYNDFAHQAAIEAGYVSTGIVLKPGEKNSANDRFERMGSGAVLNNRWLTLLKNMYKINAFRNVHFYQAVQSMYYRVKYGVD